MRSFETVATRCPGRRNTCIAMAGTFVGRRTIPLGRRFEPGRGPRCPPEELRRRRPIFTSLIRRPTDDPRELLARIAYWLHPHAAHRADRRARRPYSPPSARLMKGPEVPGLVPDGWNTGGARSVRKGEDATMRKIIATLLLITPLLAAAQTSGSDADPYSLPSAPQPEAAPPPPPDVAPGPPVTEPAPQQAPAPLVQQVPVAPTPAGQWVYTAQYGWI